MVAKSILGLVVLLPLLAGCGGAEEPEVKQEALGPAPTREAGVAAAVPAPETPPAETNAAAAVPAEPAVDSAAAAAETEAESGRTAIASRESFAYTGGPRDPFVSLLSSSRVGPELPDLTLVAIYYDTRNPSASVIVMREKITNKKYNLRPGDRLGRMRVTSVRPKDVVFTIDDFGTERQQSVSLRKQEEENTP